MTCTANLMLQAGAWQAAAWSLIHLWLLNKIAQPAAVVVPAG